MDPGEGGDTGEQHVGVSGECSSSSSTIKSHLDTFGAAPSCYICHESTTEGNKLIKLCQKTWVTMKRAASQRKLLKSNTYFEATQKIMESTEIMDYNCFYHSCCHRKFTAVKRSRDSQQADEEQPAKRQCIQTRRCSVILKSDQEGLLKGTCIFCGKGRKKKHQREEPRLKIATVGGCETISQRVRYSNNERIRSLIWSGVDLIAKEAEYHKSCRISFLKETEDRCPSEDGSHFVSHKKAFASTIAHIQDEVIEKKHTVLLSSLLEMYKKEFIVIAERNIPSYTSQNLMRKIKDHFKDNIKTALADQRRGNFIYCSVLLEEEARARLEEDSIRYEEDSKVRWAALHLRSEILKVPKTNTPNPVTVQNVKECAAKIPAQLDLFFRTLLCGMGSSCTAQKESVERKVNAMSSDAMYNVTRGSTRPWKNTVLGLGLASLTGCKIALQVLNRLGHCISYSEIKGIESEFAYSVADDQHDVPDGIALQPNLATASVWDNNDANVETLDGKETFHATVGHTYQNVIEDDQQVIINEPEFREGKNRRTFVGKDREIPEFRKSLKKATFVSTDAEPGSMRAVESITSKSCDVSSGTESSVPELTAGTDGSSSDDSVSEIRTALVEPDISSQSTTDLEVEPCTSSHSTSLQSTETKSSSDDSVSEIRTALVEPDISSRSTTDLEVEPCTSSHSTSLQSTATKSSSDDSSACTTLSVLDLYWFWKLSDGSTPLHAGFMSKYIQDSLPLQRICYMNPISRSPTNNDVVRETMIRSLNVAKETGQEHAVVTYDLAVALKAYSIQTIEAPIFDKLLIMLGNFHTELALYGAIGTFINESGIEFILTESGVLAAGSVRGFVKGKFYNRCLRIHELLANVLEKKLHSRFLRDLNEEDRISFQEVMSTVPEDPERVEDHLSDSVVTRHIQMYDDYFKAVLNGSLGKTAQYWTTYIFLINRLHREVRRCIKTNDVEGYTYVFPILLSVFFALNRPNYARWGTLFLQKLKSCNSVFHEILKKGAFSIRRTAKNYSRSAVDLSLEQTVNRDATSKMKGIVSFRNSENAVQRWALGMTQRAMAVTELRTLLSLDISENASVQSRPSRIQKDQDHMTTLSAKIDETCNPFSDDAPTSLVNLATGQAASKETTSYLLETLQRGQEARDKFRDEWNKDSARFLKPVKRIRVKNFAAQNVKQKTKLPASMKAKTNAESLRDMFIRMIVVIAQKTSFDLRYVLSYPITTYPLSLAHCDGMYMKTNKSALLRSLESLQTENISEAGVLQGHVRVYDGGLLLHSVLSQTNTGASYSSIARNMVSLVLSGKSTEVHVCLDKYVGNSIKDSERKLRGALDTVYEITGPDQTIRQSGQKLLANGVFKNELAKFLLREWGNDHHSYIYHGKTLFASYGGECYQYTPDEHNHINVSSPDYLQGDHEEADTLIAFHVEHIEEANIMVRASDTDVLVILIGALGKQRREVRAMKSVIMDCGMGNSRRYINVSNITDVLEDCRQGLPRALPGFHAFTGSDFNSAFYRKGKTKPLEIMQKDKTGNYVDLFISMGKAQDESIDLDVASEFVCRMYGQHKTGDVNEARYIKLMQMTGKVDEENPLAHIKKVDCALLPPCRQTLQMKIRRTQYVATSWTRASNARPTEGISPTDYGWQTKGSLLVPRWFDGPAIPEKLFPCNEEAIEAEESTGNIEEGIVEEQNNTLDLSSDEAWTEDSESDTED
ncbi:uncharacterized protein LOC105437992 [Strongylocentrotus purpuratus]|uniref:Uncharacterized protein n=1 Tax=Strongylocentrotus purpuratus TaxID=7668 RepID=A0A7M7NN29_STRPU|nr:uncharacterized protein LOC105437992 [Strongylocentrotus purpuratus]